MDGECIVKPSIVKKSFFYYYYEAKFQPFQGIPMVRRSHGFRSIDPDVASSIDSMFMDEEIKNMVWDCGLNRAPCPNGFTFTSLDISGDCWVMML